jgi:hypothetical protein
MARHNPSQTDFVAATFVRLVAPMHAVPFEAQHQPSGKRLIRSLGAICDGTLVLGILLAVAVSTYALLNLGHPGLSHYTSPTSTPVAEGGRD